MRRAVRSWRVRRALAAASLSMLATASLGVVLLLVSPAPPASAHTDLLSSTPSPDSTVDGVPAEVQLAFATPVQARLAQVVVSDAAGRDHVVGPVASLGPRVEAHVEGLRAGRYTVAYRVVAADGHPVVGRYAFVVAPGAVASPASGDVSGGPAPDGSTGSAGGRPWLLPLLGGVVVASVAGLRVHHARRVAP